MVTHAKYERDNMKNLRADIWQSRQNHHETDNIGIGVILQKFPLDAFLARALLSFNRVSHGLRP